MKTIQYRGFSIIVKGWVEIHKNGEYVSGWIGSIDSAKSICDAFIENGLFPGQAE